MRVGVIGFQGRVGKEILAAIANAPEKYSYVGGVGRAPDDVTKEGMRALFPACDVIIDFSKSKGTELAAIVAADCGVPLMSGTTKLEPEAVAALEAASKRIPVFYAPNTSVFVAVFMNLVEDVSRQLCACYDEGEIDVAVVDRHHNKKEDRPSGTAKQIEKAIIDGSAGKFKPEVGSFRLGTIPGEHDVIIAGYKEQLRLTEITEDRSVYAVGALNAAAFLLRQKKEKGITSGMFSMDDLIGRKGYPAGLTRAI